MGTVEELEDWPVLGEDPGIDLGEPVANHANRKVVTETGENVHIGLGELGEHGTRNVWFGSSAKEGFLTVYTRTRDTVSEHKVATITVSSIAIGAVLTGLAALKYRKK